MLMVSYGQDLRSDILPKDGILHLQLLEEMLRCARIQELDLDAMRCVSAKIYDWTRPFEMEV